MAWNFDPETRLWPHVNKAGPNDCWEWTRARTAAGYGLLTIKYKSVFAHRLAWELHNKQPIPKGMDVCHSCDNPACCNPAHLWVGSASANLLDAVSKMRWRIGVRHPSAKLTPDKVKTIRQLLTKGHSQRSIARQFGVTSGTISNIASGQTWKHVR